MISRNCAAAACGLLVSIIALEQPSAKVAKPSSVGSEPRSIQIDSRALSGFRKDGQPMPIVGKLKWRGGLVLSSSDTAFGGYSGLSISPDGTRLLAVSDAGTWLSATLSYKDNRPAGLADARIGPLLARGDKDLRKRRDRDAEAIRILRGTVASGTALIAFEINHRVGIFPIKNGVLGGPLRYLRPGRPLPANKGLEAVTPIGGHRRRADIIGFAERSLDGNGHHRGLIWPAGQGQPKAVALTAPDGFDITDAVGLDDGRLLVLERRFRWSEGVKFRIREVPADIIKPGAVLYGRTLVKADMRYEIDNMEGIAVHKDRQGRTILTLISDNNFNSFLQRTLLLQFELPATPQQAAGAR